jgi:outer membrane protein assembly factor BamE (lipoprotein component of BamABCDE complex)
MRHSASILLLAILLAGCATKTTISGSPAIDSSRVSQIHKGVTTRQELIDTFGSPAHSQMMGDGRRTLVFVSNQTTMKADNKMWIPFAGPFVGANDKHETRMQNLQVVLNRDGIVEDFEFSDQTSEISMKASAFGGSAKTTTVDNIAPAK